MFDIKHHIVSIQEMMHNNHVVIHYKQSLDHDKMHLVQPIISKIPINLTKKPLN
jgi:hypothetical protein